VPIWICMEVSAPEPPKAAPKHTYVYSYINVYMCVYVYMYVYLYINVYVCVYVYMYVYLCINVYVCVYIYTRLPSRPHLTPLFGLSFAEYSLFYRALLQKRHII